MAVKFILTLALLQLVSAAPGPDPDPDPDVHVNVEQKVDTSCGCCNCDCDDNKEFAGDEIIAKLDTLYGNGTDPAWLWWGICGVFNRWPWNVCRTAVVTIGYKCFSPTPVPLPQCWVPHFPGFNFICCGPRI